MTMSERRTPLVVSRVVRGLVGIAGVSVAALTILSATLVPVPSVMHLPPSLSVRPVAAAQQLICPGAFLQLGDEQGKNASTPHALGTPSTTSAASTGTLLRDALTLQDAEDQLAGPPLVLSADKAGSDAAAAVLAGAQSEILTSGDFQGLAASSCEQASTDAWLVGGSTTVGRTTLITIANPSDIVATVALDIFGENGPVSAPGSAGILVSPRSQRVFSLAGFAPDLGAPVVHVTSTGGPVASFLQETIVRGIEPGGVDIVAPTGVPSRFVTIPGVVVSNSAQIETLLGGDGYADLGTVLRVLVPGKADGTAQVRITSESADVAGASFSLNLAAGTVTDFPVEGLTDGAYSISVKSDVPIVAATRTSTVAPQSAAATSAGAIDLAWFGAARALDGSVFLVVAHGDHPVLHLSNTSDAATTVQVHPTLGRATTAVVAAGSSVSVAVTAGQSYVLDGFTTVFACISYSGTGRLATLHVNPSTAALKSVTVYP